jgi:hypothetical protein
MRKREERYIRIEKKREKEEERSTLRQRDTQTE